MNNKNEILKLKDKELLEKFSVLVKEEKEAMASVVAHLSEIDRRKLYALEGYSSLFNYVTQKYHYSEGAAYRRIQAARVGLKFPEIVNLLKEGKVTLMNLSLVAPHLTHETKEKILSEIIHKPTRQVESFISSYFGKPESTKDKIRVLPLPAPKVAQNFTFSAESKIENKEEVSQKEQGAFLEMPLALSDIANPEVQETRKVKIEFVADEKVAELIQRAKEVLRHKYPQGKLEDLVREAFELLLEKKDPGRKIKRHAEGQSTEASLSRFLALGARNDKKTRYVPEKIKQTVWKRDEGKCSYVSSEGKQCGEKNFLELDHVHPWSLGGDSTANNLRLLCRTHNQWRAEKTFGI